MHTPKKSTNISSAIGRMPSAAAPRAVPRNAVSEIGVSMMRSLPKRSSSPEVALNMPPYLPMSSPITKTLGSRSISEAIASEIAWAMVSLRAAAAAWGFACVAVVAVASAMMSLLRIGCGRSGGHVLQRCGGFRVGAGTREVEGGVDLALRLAAHALELRIVGDAALLQHGTQRQDRIVPLQLLDLALGPVRLGVALEVAEEAVGLDLDQRRPPAAACARHRLAGATLFSTEMAHLLSSHTNTTGSFHSAARLSDS